MSATPLKVETIPVHILSCATLKTGRILDKQAAVMPTAGSMHVHTELGTSLSARQVSFFHIQPFTES
jgi:hypothetical protein